MRENPTAFLAAKQIFEDSSENWDDLFYDDEQDWDGEQGWTPEEDEGPSRGGPNLLRWLLLLLLAALLVTALAFVPRIQHYTVAGSEQLTSEAVMETCGLARGQHLFTINHGNIQAAIEKDPHYILQDINYEFPNGLRISVTERNRDACVRYLDKDIVIASDGIVLEVGATGDFPEVIRLQGVSVTGYALGELIGVQDDFQLSVAGKVLDVLRSTGYVADYDLIDLSNPVDLRLLSKNRITVRIGQMQGMEEKLAKAAIVLRFLAEDGHYGGVVDASTEKLAYRDSALGGIEIPQELLTAGESSGVAPFGFDFPEEEGGEEDGAHAPETRENEPTGQESSSGRGSGTAEQQGESSSPNALLDLPSEDGIEEDNLDWLEDLDEISEEGQAEEGDMLPGLTEEGSVG